MSYKDYKNKEQAKSGLYNPKFQDIAQYGAQSTLMYLYLTDPNLNKWYLYFQKNHNPHQRSYLIHQLYFYF